MSLHLTPSSDWDGWTPPDMDQISDIPTIGSDQDINDLASALADADATPQARRRKSRKRRRTSSTAGVAAGPTSRRKSQKRRRTLSTTGVVAGPTSRSAKIRVRGKKRQRRAPKNDLGGVWLDSRATLHSLVSKMPWAKVPLVQSLRR